LDLKKINNPSQEALDEIAVIVDKYTKTSDVAGKEIKHLSKDGAVDKIFKEVQTKGYKRPSVAKELFKQVLESKGITTYDNYRTNKIVFTLQDVLRKNDGNILSIKPSAVAEILPEFAIGGKKGGKGLPIFRTFLNYLEGSERLIDRSGLEKPGQIAGKPVNQIIDEMKQNFLEIKGGKARGNFTVFEETKLLEKIGLENPNATANELKKLYEKAGGNSFRERVNTLYLAKTGQVTNKTDGGKSIIDAVRSGEITNKRPDSLRNSFKTYVKDYNFARFTRFAGEETDPKMIRYYNDIARKFFTTGAQTKYGTKGLVAEHGLPISAYDRGVADISTRAKIDGYVTTEVNNWKAKNFDFPVFRPGGLADKYKNASAADKPKIQAQIEEKLKLVKNRTPELVKNITFDFTDGKFTASSSTPVISEDIIENLKKTGANVNQMFNIEAYITDRTGKVKQPMLPSGLAGVGEMLSDDLKAIVNSEAYKTWKATIADPALEAAGKAVKVGSKVAALPTKFFGAADLVLGYLDYSNNRQKGFSKADSTRHMVDAVLFGVTSFGKKGDIAGVRKIANKNGMSNEVFDNLMALNLNQKKMMDTIDKSKAKFNESMDIIESGASDPNAEKMLIQKLKKDTNTILAETMRKIVDDSRSLNTNLQVKEAGAPIDINVDTLKAYGDLGSASRKFVQNRIDASDLEKIASQKDTTKGGIGDEVMSGVKGVLSQGKFAYDLLNPFSPLPKSDDWKPKDLKYKEQMAKLKKEDPTMYYKMLMSEGVDPRINLNIPVHLEWEQKNPEFGTQYSDSLTQNKAEGGIIGLRSKYEYKK
ncbi:MAG: hypothetical protein HN566_05070, partial [Polaribacter sp.]|nr:hypothetical protein [Polaribacter sp.]